MAITAALQQVGEHRPMDLGPVDKGLDGLHLMSRLRVDGQYNGDVHVPLQDVYNSCNVRELETRKYKKDVIRTFKECQS